MIRSRSLHAWARATLVAALGLLAPAREAGAQAPIGTVPSLGARVTSVRFFETPYDMVPRDKRQYAAWFERAPARFIGFELNLAHPSPAQRTPLSVEQVWIRPNGSILARQRLQTYVDPGWTASYHQQSWGWRNPGSWPEGTYRLSLFVDGQQVASGRFTLFRASPDAARAFNEGSRMVREKRHRDAVPYFDRAIALEPEFARAYTNRCFALAVLDQFDRALPDCERALALDPLDSSALYDRGTIYITQKQYDRAITDLSAVLELTPRSGAAYANRAAAYYSKGDHDRAWQDVRKAQELDYPVPPALLEKLRRASGQAR